MGASFQWMTLTFPDHDKAAVETAFQQAQEDDRRQNGQMYSGGFGMADGLEFTGRHASDRGAAIEWLENNCVKWEAAKVMTYDDDQQGKCWIIGAWCAE